MGCSCNTSIVNHYVFCACLQLLKSEVGQTLRKQHQSTVKQVKEALVSSGVPTVDTPSHIIPVKVSSHSFDQLLTLPNH